MATTTEGGTATSGASAAASETAASGTSWRRAGAMFVVCMVAVGILAFGLITGAIPVAFGLSKNPFKISLDRLDGTRITGYVGNSPKVDDGDKALVLAGVEGGDGSNLCLSTVLDLPFIGDLSVKITSGQSKTIPLEKLMATGTDLKIDEVTIRDVELGRDAETLDRNDLLDGTGGSFGLQMESADVTGMRLDGESLRAGSLRLRGLGLALKLGKHECY